MPRSKADLAEVVCVITGGGHGIGRAYASELASRGAGILVVDLDGAAATGVARGLVDAGGRAHAVAADVRDPRALDAALQECVEALGPPTALVNNAAIFSTVPMSRAGFDALGVDEWDRMFEVNVRGAWLATVVFTRPMREAGYGKVVNISSETALKGANGRLHYVASKAAVLGLTKTLARELGGEGVRVNCIAPGNTLSEEDPSPEVRAMREQAAGQRALKRLQTPEDIVGAVAFLVSPESDFITGQTLVVDGGTYMH